MTWPHAAGGIGRPALEVAAAAFPRHSAVAPAHCLLALERDLEAEEALVVERASAGNLAAVLLAAVR